MPSTVWFLEPTLIVFLLLGGTVANRRRTSRVDLEAPKDNQSISSLEGGISSDNESLIYSNDAAVPFSVFGTTGLRDRPSWRTRNVGIFGWKRSIATPDTRQYRGYFLSNMLYRYPFMIEAWYWFLIYWVCLFPRASDTFMRRLFVDNKVSRLTSLDTRYTKSRVRLELSESTKAQCSLHGTMRFSSYP